jgi:hypothetical protein
MIIRNLFTFIVCPCCGHPKEKRIMLSGNTNDVTLWTDGIIQYPMFLTDPDVLKCYKCCSFFWFEDRLEINAGQPTELYFKLSKMSDEMKDLTVEEYYESIRSELCASKEIEKRLRLDAWRRWNDTLRGCGDYTLFSVPDRIEHWKENLLNLLSLLDEHNEKECLIKAEIYRNLKEYQKSKELLSKKFSNQNQAIVNLLIKLCDTKQWQVKKVG